MPASCAEIYHENLETDTFVLVRRQICFVTTYIISLSKAYRGIYCSDAIPVGSFY